MISNQPQEISEALDSNTGHMTHKDAEYCFIGLPPTS